MLWQLESPALCVGGGHGSVILLLKGSFLLWEWIRWSSCWIKIRHLISFLFSEPTSCRSVRSPLCLKCFPQHHWYFLWEPCLTSSVSPHQSEQVTVFNRSRPVEGVTLTRWGKQWRLEDVAEQILAYWCRRFTSSLLVSRPDRCLIHAVNWYQEHDGPGQAHQSHSWITVRTRRCCQAASERQLNVL